MFKNDSSQKKTTLGGIISFFTLLIIISYVVICAQRINSSVEDDSLIQQYEVMLNLDKLGAIKYHDLDIDVFHVLRKKGKPDKSLLVENGLGRYLNVQYK